MCVAADHVRVGPFELDDDPVRCGRVQLKDVLENGGGPVVCGEPDECSLGDAQCAQKVLQAPAVETGAVERKIA